MTSQAKTRSRWSKVASSLLWALAASVPAMAGGQAAPYTYTGNIVTDMSAATCRPTNATQESTTVFREIFSGLQTSGSSTGSRPFTCPLVRRNTTLYNVSIPDADVASRLDKVRMTFLQISVNDGATDGPLFCTAQVTTGLGSFFVSSTKYACGNGGGCTTAPPDSARVITDLTWTNPFGSGTILNQGSASIVYTCVVPRASGLVWARAAFDAN